MTRPTLDDLERRYDGIIPEDERRMADGINVPLAEARGAVRFWRDQLDKAKEAYRACTDAKRHLTLRETEEHARAGLKRAEARLRDLEPPDPDAGPKAFLNHITRGV